YLIRQRNQCLGPARSMVQGRRSHDFCDQGWASGRRLRGCRRVVRRATGPALPTRRAKPRRATEQGGRDLKRMLELGFSFSGGAALLAAGSLGLAVAQLINGETFPAGPARTDCCIALAVSIGKSPRSPPVLRSSKPRLPFIAR